MLGHLDAILEQLGLKMKAKSNKMSKQNETVKLGSKSLPKYTNILENRALRLSWSTLGSLSAPRWRKSDNKSENEWKISDFRVAQKSPTKNLVKNRMNFKSDFEKTFSRYWVEVGAKNLSEMRGLRVIFSTSLRRCEKYDYEHPSTFFLCFSILKASILELQGYIFHLFFRTRFVEVLFSILGRILVQIGQMGAKIYEKIN